MTRPFSSVELEVLSAHGKKSASLRAKAKFHHCRENLFWYSFYSFYVNLTEKIYVTASQSARGVQAWRQAQCSQALRAHRTPQEARPVEGRRPHHRPPQNQTRRVKSDG